MEERAAQPVSNVSQKEEQCLRNRQSRQDGGGGVCNLLAPTVPQCLFPTSKGREGRGKRQAALQEDLFHFEKRQKEVSHHLFVLLTSCLRKGDLLLNNNLIIVLFHTWVTKN